MVGALPICPIDRYLIADLVQIISDEEPFLEGADISTVLKDEVNSADDKLAKEHRKKFTKGDSISAAEAYKYLINNIISGNLEANSTSAIVARNLHAIYFRNTLFSGPPPYPIRILRAHDADTITAVIEQPVECNTGSVTESIRLSGPDAPEVGPWNEWFADMVRLQRENNDPTYIYPYKKPSYPYEQIHVFYNSKTVENVDKLHLEFAKGRWDPKEISYGERVAINSIIAATIDYTGRLATIPRRDLLTWEIDPKDEDNFVLMPSQIRWTSDDTPKVLCGAWQFYDTYSRGLGFVLETDENRLSKYLRTRLADAMVDKKIHRELIDEYAKDYKKIYGKDKALPKSITEKETLFEFYHAIVEKNLKFLEKSENAALRKFAKDLVASVPKPEVIYSAKQCEMMADEFDGLVAKHPELATDDQAMQIVIGSVYNYIKYRHQRADAYKEIGKGFGLWNELTFLTLSQINDRDPRYDPPDCMK